MRDGDDRMGELCAGAGAPPGDAGHCKRSEIEEDAPVKHANTSSSNIHRRMRCPGSRAAEEGLPDIDSEASSEGTMLHANYARQMIDSTLAPLQRDVLAAAFDSALEIFERVEKEHGIGSQDDFTEGFERELWLHRGMKPIFSGHCDQWRFYTKQKLLVIIDQKFGRLPVESAEANMQLRSYAVQGCEEWPAETTVVAISQPRLHEEERVTIASYSRGDIHAARAQLLAIWDACHAPDAPRQPDEDACRYCRAKLHCPEFQAQVHALIPIGGTMALSTASDADFSKLLLAIKLAANEQFVSQVKEEAMRRIMEGRLEDYELRANAPRRYIADQVGAYLALSLDFTAAEYAEFAEISIGKATKAYRVKYGGTEAEAKTYINNRLGDAMRRSAPAQSIVRRGG